MVYSLQEKMDLQVSEMNTGRNYIDFWFFCGQGQATPLIFSFGLNIGIQKSNSVSLSDYLNAMGSKSSKKKAR
jgi:hypothetical protein